MKNDIKNLVKLSISNKAADFKKAFDNIMSSKILDKIDSVKSSIGKTIFNKGE